MAGQSSAHRAIGSHAYRPLIWPIACVYVVERCA